MLDSKEHHILMFDSGAGGLSIVKCFLQFLNNRPETHTSIDTFEKIQLHYLADFEGFPYSQQSPESIIQRTTSLIQSFVEKQPVDMIVVGCNTASTLCLERLRSNLKIPIVGVVPAIKPAAQQSIKKSIVVLATPVTVEGQYLNDLQTTFAPECTVLNYPAKALVEMAEAYVLKPNDLELHAEILQKVTSDVRCILNHFESASTQPDCWVLACTHFPLLKPWFHQCFKALNIHGEIIDSGNAIVQRMCHILKLHSHLKYQVNFKVVSACKFETKVAAYQAFIETSIDL